MKPHGRTLNWAAAQHQPQPFSAKTEFERRRNEGQQSTRTQILDEPAEFQNKYSTQLRVAIVAFHDWLEQEHNIGSTG